MRRVAGVVTTLIATLAVGVAPAYATTSGGIALYLSGPLVQGAEIDSAGTLTEDFNSLGGSPTLDGGTCPTALAIGTVSTAPSTAACQYRTPGIYGGAAATTSSAVFGGDGSNYFGTYNLSDAAITFTFPAGGVKYVGFWWSGGNRGNVVTFYNGATEIATLDTLALETLLGNAPPSSWPSGNGSVTSMGGTAYAKGHYFGNPRGYTESPPLSQSAGLTQGGAGPYIDHRGYVYAYLNLFLTGDQTATSVKFSGNGFEFDNLTTSTLEQTPAPSLVFAKGLLGKTAQFLPGATDATGSMVAQASTTAASLSANRYERAGYTFTGWNTAENGTGTPYGAGANFNFATDLTLYAQWAVAPTVSTTSGSSVTPTPVVPTPTVTPRPTRMIPQTPSANPVSQPVVRPAFGFDPDAPARGTIGGVATNVSNTPRGSAGVSVVAGAFQFGVSLNGAEGAEVHTETPSRSPELFMPRGQSAAVSGSGSYPGSFVQLWLPNGTTSRELARIPVRSDGTFTSEGSFAAGSLEMPVPIGRQVLQVVGYDERGNQTVVDMTINIGQGAPAPEPNRQVGELPALASGQSLGTSGGMPETVSVTGLPDSGSVVVEGGGWAVSVIADQDNGVVENPDGTVLVRLDQSSMGTTSGSGFLPGTLATVWLFSEPTLMATVTVDENGEFSSEFLVDSRLIAPGEHTLQIQGVGTDGYVKAANLGVLVEQPVDLTTENASGLLWWALGVFALALVLVFLLIARRRRHQNA
jgi:uncharacterized repeat protein (TIGR02543 family)